ncbi:ester cyclase [Hymenobacter sp. DG25A]|uniref:ester cyclase n=1 Tax=Hymenobacter sp. DG25A TaxID=1385663 RepID=UPI000AF10487|nr:ester cyclase [Hymenobacter sp. DG25A]
MMVEEDNRETVLRYVAAFNEGDMEALQQVFSPDAQVYGVLGWGSIKEAIPIWQELWAAFGLQLLIESMVAEGEVVAVRYTERGHSVGSFRGGPVTGKSYEIVAMEWFQMHHGKIHRRWGARDYAAQMRQMGLPLS